jgi:hypothetical protein
MKQPPQPGECRLSHLTLSSDDWDCKIFGLNWHNYDLSAVHVAEHMLQTGENVGGFRLTQQKEHGGFTVWFGATKITNNTVEIQDKTVRLTTSVLPSAVVESAETLATSADLEQCAAIALVLAEGLPGLFTILGAAYGAKKRPN